MKPSLRSTILPCLVIATIFWFGYHQTPAVSIDTDSYRVAQRHRDSRPITVDNGEWVSDAVQATEDATMVTLHLDAPCQDTQSELTFGLQILGLDGKWQDLLYGSRRADEKTVQPIEITKGLPSTRSWKDQWVRAIIHTKDQGCQLNYVILFHS